MTAVATRRPAARQHPALADAIERRLLRLSARLAAHSVTLREATDELYAIHLRQQTISAQTSALRMPAPLADAYVQTAASSALLEVRVDEQASALDIARAERPLGAVLVLADGSTEGARPVPAREPLDVKDLW
ncbi:hypothetical protein G7075_04460 [Phycicoccus sp. HDW14]|uniref:hypothetical protein n=1 Tax=Phycicoccus sp. HDW14 TaxID=2714941 RepID=UPI0014090725|nr:hypothetical protein [Phycicoccus sp. HDW14]QIM19907.1 hypothetical protein G7075_00150 [Phycicoccus sp. HDW14]QIM20570.1 hypothetical protein G7075_04460 [Phycicoccus sp. HDW14]